MSNAETIAIIAAHVNANTAGTGLPFLPEAPSREDLIAWLCSNDRNGCYTDEDNRAEGWPPLTYGELAGLVLDAVGE